MRTAVLVVAMLVPVFAQASWVDSVEAPSTAIVGESFVPQIRLILLDECWFFDSFQLLENEFVVTVDIVAKNDSPLDNLCGGSME